MEVTPADLCFDETVHSIRFHPTEDLIASALVDGKLFMFASSVRVDSVVTELASEYRSSSTKRSSTVSHVGVQTFLNLARVRHVSFALISQCCFLGVQTSPSLPWDWTT
jgi:hypothetical protein